MSVPFNRIVPSVGVTSRMMQFATVLFPLPDSPTRPTSSPRPIVKDTSSTACTTPFAPNPRTGKCLTSPSTSSTGG